VNSAVSDVGLLATAMGFLVIGFGDHAADPAGSQVGADRARYVLFELRTIPAGPAATSSKLGACAGDQVYRVDRV
jgi:hypothetical protein